MNNMKDNKWQDNNKRWSQLMTLVQSGHQKAYYQLLSEISMVLKQYFAKRLWNQDFVDDLAQETLLNLHQSRHTYHPNSPFINWLFAIAHHKLIDFIRKYERQISREVSNEALFKSICSQSIQESVEFSIDIEKALATLSDKQRQAVEYHKLKGLSVKESAQKMGISVSALKVNAHRAYKALKKILGESREYE